MKYILTFIVFLISMNSFSQTQAEMNENAAVQFKTADKRLNTIYQQILSTYKSDSIFIKNLKVSQRHWINFRDSELEMRYPNYSAENKGSVYPMCRSFYLKELTDIRIKTLNKWLIGIEEGDVCTGSIKLKLLDRN